MRFFKRKKPVPVFTLCDGYGPPDITTPADRDEAARWLRHYYRKGYRVRRDTRGYWVA